MHRAFHIHSRDELIAFGSSLAKAMQGGEPNKQWIICLGADEQSGKGLIALAIDNQFNPSRYPDNITSSLSADRLLDVDNDGHPKVVFHNFRRPIELTKEMFDERLSEFRAKSPNAKVLIAANIERTFFGEFDYRSRGLDSDILDISMQVRKRGDPFKREIAVTVRDEELLKMLTHNFAEPTAKRSGDGALLRILHKPRTSLRLSHEKPSP